MQKVKPGKALDLGCGQGRNALFLAQQGFDVTAVDQNELSLEILQSIVEQEDLEMPVGLSISIQLALDKLTILSYQRLF